VQDVQLCTAIEHVVRHALVFFESCSELFCDWRIFFQSDLAAGIFFVLSTLVCSAGGDCLGVPNTWNPTAAPMLELFSNMQSSKPE